MPASVLRRVRSIAAFVGSAVLLALGVFFAFNFYDRYWRWRDCFNELGRCFDPASQDVYLEQSGMEWGTLSAIALAAGLILLRARKLS
jgi:hypothetical protein